MTIYHLHLPLSDQESKNMDKFHAGDIIYLSGIIGTGRDHVHHRILEYNLSNQSLPDSFHYFSKGAIYHMGPIVKKIQEDEYQIISGGPTTSARMNLMQKDVCRILKPSFVIGKGGMEGVPWRDLDAIYLSFPGGAGAIVSKFIQKIIAVEWLDLGTPEATWFLDIKEFGPLIVSIDTHGQNLYLRRD
ncbi:MAG: FumA C-terminus/TtdB family hydratase beta subunit [Promethearchaeota archaeon]